jgi:general stress protein 26
MAPTTGSNLQALPLADDELDELLHTADIARLATHNEDGSIHCAPLWFRYRAPELLIGTRAGSRKLRNIERDPRVTVLVGVTSPAPIGAVVYGTACIDRSADAVGERVWICSKYVGEGAESYVGGFPSDWDLVTIHVTPHEVVTFDYRECAQQGDGGGRPSRVGGRPGARRCTRAGSRRPRACRGSATALP